jgi:tetratricopeptide (TPR) repeat protein
VTSRIQLRGLAATHCARLLSLEPLTGHDSELLLATRLGAERLSAEPGAAGRLIELCGGLPLALAITAARAAAAGGTQLAAVADELAGARSRLDALDAGEAVADARTVFSWSFQGLSGAAASVFHLIGGLHPGPDVSAAAAASLAGVPAGQLSQALRELARDRLLTESAPGRYSCHDLLRSYAREQAGDLTGQREQRAAQQRMFDHYLHTASAAALLMYPHLKPAAAGDPSPGVRPEPLADAEQARAWFRSEHRVLLSVIEAAAEYGFGAHAWRIAWAFRTYLEWRGFWRDEVTCLRTALEAAQKVQDEAGQASIHWALDLAYARLGRYDEARRHNRQARALYRQINDPGAEANTHMSSAWASEREGHFDEALADALQALELFRAAGHSPGEAAALNNAAWFHAMLANYPEARDYCERAIELSQRLGNRFIEANARHSLGYIQHLTGDHAAAIACYRDALELMNELGNRQNVSEVLDRLGDAFQATGDTGAARESWEQAVAILDGQDHPGAQVIRGKLATL